MVIAGTPHSLQRENTDSYSLWSVEEDILPPSQLLTLLLYLLPTKSYRAERRTAINDLRLIGGVSDLSPLVSIRKDHYQEAEFRAQASS